MKETYNWKSLFAGSIIILVGIGLSIGGALAKTDLWESLLLGIGCSLVASGVVILVHDFFVERCKVSVLDNWNIEQIYTIRAEINKNSEQELKVANHCLDAVAFGLRSFRGKQSPRVEEMLRKGVNVRIITMDPNSQYANVRDVEESKAEGDTKKSIEELIDWANKLNKNSKKGKIEVKGYNSMTLDFYWRIDDILYVGPYWYGVDSQQTITYRYSKGGEGFRQYSEHFESLWANDTLCKTMTSETINRKSKRKQ